MSPLQIKSALVVVLVVSCQGCSISKNGRIVRMWADYNTLGTPAFYIEEVDHLPYKAKRVQQFNWMYNKMYSDQSAVMGRAHGLTTTTDSVPPADQEPSRSEFNVPPSPAPDFAPRMPPEPMHYPMVPDTPAPGPFYPDSESPSEETPPPIAQQPRAIRISSIQSLTKLVPDLPHARSDSAEPRGGTLTQQLATQRRNGGWLFANP